MNVIRMIISALLMGSISAYDLPAKCRGIVRTRAEWHSLTVAQKSAYVDAIKELHASKKFEEFARIHANQMGGWHKGALFLVAHRQFVHNYESALLAINPNLVFPYWDFTLTQDVYAADVWNYLGRPNSGKGCVNGGRLDKWELTFPNQRCLQRYFDDKSQYRKHGYTPQTIGVFTRDTDSFIEFSKNLENGAHAVIHSAIGGDMVSDVSPCDPVFFLIHGYVDKLYFDWQTADPQKRLKQFGGNQPYTSSNAVNENTKINGFDVTVKEILNTLDMCYVYVNPNTKFEPVNGSGAVPNNSGNSTLFNQNYTAIPDKPAKPSEEFLRGMGYKKEEIEKTYTHMTEITAEVKIRIRQGEKVYGSGVDPDQVKNPKDNSPFPQETVKVGKSNTIPIKDLTALIPTFNNTKGDYSFGDGAFLPPVEQYAKSSAHCLVPQALVSVFVIAATLLF